MRAFRVACEEAFLSQGELDRDLRLVRAERTRCERILKRATFRLVAAQAEGAGSARIEELRELIEIARADLWGATFDVDRYEAAHPVSVSILKAGGGYLGPDGYP